MFLQNQHQETGERNSLNVITVKWSPALGQARPGKVLSNRWKVSLLAEWAKHGQRLTVAVGI